MEDALPKGLGDLLSKRDSPAEEKPRKQAPSHPWYNQVKKTPIYATAPSNRMPRSVVVKEMLAAYRLAYQDHFGKQSWAYSGGISERDKDFLDVAADELREHEIDPYRWASWRIKWFKDKNAIPNVKRVFTGITKMRGFYRKENPPTTKAETPRVVLESMLRIREANGGLNDSMPDWYLTMREQEKAKGITDPMTRMPVHV